MHLWCEVKRIRVATFVLCLLTIGCSSDDTPAADGDSDASAAVPDAREGTTVDGALELPDATTVGGCANGAQSLEQLTIQHGGRTRTVSVAVPPSYQGAPTPLVINFHGLNTTAEQQMLFSGMESAANAKGYIAVHPQGIGNSWNAGLCCGTAETSGVDDVGFVGALLDRLEQELCIDNKRVYATGLSNGGHMSYRLACDLADRFTAVASVAGTLTLATCGSSRPVPLLQLHGTADFIVPYSGAGFLNSVEGTVAQWASSNSCASTASTVYDNGDTSCVEYAGCSDDAAVQLCTIDGGGHQWPNGVGIPGLGTVTTDIDGSNYILDFFARFQMP